MQVQEVKVLDISPKNIMIGKKVIKTESTREWKYPVVAEFFICSECRRSAGYGIKVRQEYNGRFSPSLFDKLQKSKNYFIEEFNGAMIEYNWEEKHPYYKKKAPKDIQEAAKDLGKPIANGKKMALKLESEEETMFDRNDSFDNNEEFEIQGF